MDLFEVPTIGFKLLYGFVIIRLDRRDFVWIGVTTNPTAEWVARQITDTEAFPWDSTPRYMIRDRDYMIRDRDRIYGTIVTRRLRAMMVVERDIGRLEHPSVKLKRVRRDGGSVGTPEASSRR